MHNIVLTRITLWGQGELLSLSFSGFQEHIFNLMKNDSYSRFIRSDQYKEYKNQMKRIRATPNKISIFGAKPALHMLNAS